MPHHNQYGSLPNRRNMGQNKCTQDYRSPSEKCRNQNPDQHSQTIGPDGPVLLQDTILHETLDTFVHEKMIERAVHTKGYGAFGCFTAYQSMRPYTKASFLQRPGQVTYTFSRFSFAVSTKGTPDTARNVRGFSTKFYTDSGVFDLLCNHIPVFLVRDAMKFPTAIKSLSPSASNNLPNPLAFWKFVAETPESAHFVTLLYSDLGTLASFRCMRTYGVNTYVWENEKGVRRYVKYHWIPSCQECTLTRQEAAKLAGENPNIAGEELYNTLAGGETYQYELCVQFMNMDEACSLSFDPLDDTKVWDQEQFPLTRVGCLTLDRNVDNYQQQVEKAAFSPANLIDGIQLSADKMLQGRSFVYWDAQRRRIGPDFRDIPVNHEEKWSPDKMVSSGNGACISGTVMRSEIEKEDNFTQAGEHYLSLCQEARDHLVDNIASELYSAPEHIRNCVLSYLSAANQEYGARVQECMYWYQKQL